MNWQYRNPCQRDMTKTPKLKDRAQIKNKMVTQKIKITVHTTD